LLRREGRRVDARAGVQANLVHFTPGARTAWHAHPLGQTIYVTEGIGLCQKRGDPIEVIRPGDRPSSRASVTSNDACFDAGVAAEKHIGILWLKTSRSSTQLGRRRCWPYWAA
jgi:hypothetical protein